MSFHSGKLNVSVVMPALNEEKNILAAIRNALEAFDGMNIIGEVIVISDGSTDQTPDLVRALALKDNRVRIVIHKRPHGIGSSFWKGVGCSRGEVVVMLPGDNENDPLEIFRYYKLLEHVDIVIPFIFNKEVRSIFRNALSLVYRFIINTTFRVNFNYTNGTILYRRAVLRELHHHSRSFFFQTDILVRLAKEGYLFAEVPYRLDLRKEGVSKAATFPSFLKVVRGYLRLVRDFYFSGAGGKTREFAKGSLTSQRRQNEK
ncbi:MAG: glycosyltransferase family 2 protein [Candidatus Omnitrophota bacterium]